MSEQYISKERKEIWHCHPAIKQKKTSSCVSGKNLDHFALLKEYMTELFHLLLMSVCQNLLDARIFSLKVLLKFLVSCFPYPFIFTSVSYL